MIRTRCLALVLALATLSPVLAGCYVEEGPPPPRAVYVESRPGWVWIPGHWLRRPGRYVWVEGHWRAV